MSFSTAASSRIPTKAKKPATGTPSQPLTKKAPSSTSSRTTSSIAPKKPNSQPKSSISILSKPTPDASPKPVKPIGSHAKISTSRFNQHKASNPFSSKASGNSTSAKKHKTTFSSLYDSNQIPCRIFHSTAQMRLQWDSPLSQMPDSSFTSLLVSCAEGLRETTHPYCTIASLAFKEMCADEHARDRINASVLDAVVMQIRTALMDKDSQVFMAAVEAVGSISNAVGEALDPYLDKILIQLGKKSFQKAYTQKITQTLNILEENSGKAETTKKIRAKVPTYESIMF